MSDPSLIQITFKIKPEMPKDMKKLILMCFTNYYTEYYQSKTLTHEEYLKLGEKYPAIFELDRCDAYHNVINQQCQLDPLEVYDLDTGKILNDDCHLLDTDGNPVPNPTPSIGICITTLPRHPETLDEFFKLVGPYIDSEVCTLGIQHFYDYGETVAYYYIDKLGNIKKHMIQRAPEDETIFDNGLTKWTARKLEIVKDIETTEQLSDEEKQILLDQVDDYVNEEFGENNK